MKLAKFSLILTALVYLAIGIIFLVDPVYWASSLDISLPTKTAIIDLRATYGGCMLALGVFFLYSIKSRLFIRTGLVLQALTFAGFGLSRAAGIFIDGTPRPIMFYLLIAEICGFGLAVYCLWQIGKTDKI